MLQPHEKDYVICYLDDILIHSKTQEDHLKHLREILTLLAESKLKLRMEKCNFALSHLDYLGHTISGQGIQPSKKKIEAVVEWPKPQTVKQVQSFLGFCNFYRRYVPKYSQISNPLYNFTKKDVKIDWNLECENAFQQLKHLLTTAPVNGPNSRIFF